MPPIADPNLAYLVVNADDFGLSRGINEGIVRAHEGGIVSSATLMVHGEAAEEAATYARAHPGLGLGLHVDLFEAVLRNGQWVFLYARCEETEEAVRREVHRQLKRFRDLVGRDPDHLDTHQHVHRRWPTNQVLPALSEALGLPFRGSGGFGYVGGFYGQDAAGGPYPEGTTPARLVELIDELPRGQVTELSCHPGSLATDDPLGGTMYRSSRNLERDALVHPLVRQRVQRGDVVLGTFAQFAHLAAASRGSAGSRVEAW